jgi:hypothetical protein
LGLFCRNTGTSTKRTSGNPETALRHGLIAETVIDVLEDTEGYASLQIRPTISHASLSVTAAMRFGQSILAEIAQILLR